MLLTFIAAEHPSLTHLLFALCFIERDESVFPFYCPARLTSFPRRFILYGLLPQHDWANGGRLPDGGTKDVTSFKNGRLTDSRTERTIKTNNLEAINKRASFSSVCFFNFQPNKVFKIDYFHIKTPVLSKRMNYIKTWINSEMTTCRQNQDGGII